MGGPDTIRGINFQTLCAILKALKLIEDPNVGFIAVEGQKDIVDIEISDRNGKTTSVIQAKSRVEPYVWRDSELTEMIRKWYELDDENVNEYFFITNGQMSIKNKIVKFLDSIKSNNDFTDELDKLNLTGIPISFLKKISIITRYGEIDRLYDVAVLRVAGLLELIESPSIKKAESIVDQFFKNFSLAGGEQSFEKRVFSREDLLKIIGVSSSTIDNTTRWDSKLKAIYLKSIIDSINRIDFFHPYIELKNDLKSYGLLISERDFRHISSEEEITTDQLLSFSEGVCIYCPAGYGKSTTLKQLSVRAAHNDIIPIYLQPNEYFRGELLRYIREAIETHINIRLIPDFINSIVDRDKIILMIDGLTELPLQERNSLKKDLLEFKRKYPSIIVIVSGRDLPGLTKIQLPIYRLKGLRRNHQVEIAKTLIGNDHNVDMLCHNLSDKLGTLIENPLLFILSISLIKSGSIPESRIDLYSKFVDQLIERHKDEIECDLNLCVLSLLCHEMVSEDRVRDSRLTMLMYASKALKKLEEKKIFNINEKTSEAVISDLEKIGLIKRSGISRSISLLHDSFRDYFAALSIDYNFEDLPEYLNSRWEKCILFLSEKNDISDEIIFRASRDNIKLAIQLADFEKPQKRQVDTEFLADLLNLILENHFSEDAKKFLTLGKVSANSFLGDNKLYIAIKKEGVSINHSSADKFNNDINSAYLTLSVPKSYGVLKIIKFIWLTLIDKALKIYSFEKPQYIPTSVDGLIEAIMAHYQKRIYWVNKIANYIAPTISNIITTNIGWDGFEARILKSKSCQFNGNKVKEHPLVYRYIPGKLEIEFAKEKPSREEWSEIGYTTAESFLSDTPLQEALWEIRKSIDDITKPTF